MYLNIMNCKKKKNDNLHVPANVEKFVASNGRLLFTNRNLISQELSEITCIYLRIFTYFSMLIW